MVTMMESVAGMSLGRARDVDQARMWTRPTAPRPRRQARRTRVLDGDPSVGRVFGDVPGRPIGRGLRLCVLPQDAPSRRAMARFCYRHHYTMTCPAVETHAYGVVNRDGALQGLLQVTPGGGPLVRAAILARA